MRVSSKTQDERNGEARQKEALIRYGIQKNNLYYDVMTGTKAHRPALDKLLDFARKGDTVVVSELSRIGRNTKNCLELIEELNSKGIRFVAIKEGIDTDTELGKFFLTICSAFNELELSYIRERCQQGIDIAKKEGRMGRPKTDPRALEHAINLYTDTRMTVKDITEITGVSNSVIYRETKKRGIMRTK